MRPSWAPRSTPSWTSAARPRSTRSPLARRSCSRPTSDAGPAATTRRGASPSRSCATRWSRPSSGSGPTRRRSRSSISRCATRPWGRAPSWSRPAARLRRDWSRLGRDILRRSRRSRQTKTRSCTPAAWSRSAASTASTRTRLPPISQDCRCGSPRWRATTNSRSSIMR